MDVCNKFINELNNNKKNKRLGIHSFHRYYGKLIPAIPETAINIFSNKGELVFDPFMGSGTTGVESLKLGRKFLGVDINPLSCLISRSKLNVYDTKVLNFIYKDFEDMFSNLNNEINDYEIPFLLNRDHWFEKKVQYDLVYIRKCIDNFIIENKLKMIYKDFLLSTLSSMIKQVSYADNMHVFPGVSKRIKRLIENNEISFNVKTTFLNFIKKRIKYVEEFQHKSQFTIINSSSSNTNLKKYYNKVDLVVTNPPYISSIRYSETMKLELYWMQFCVDQNEFRELSMNMIGFDKFRVNEIKENQNSKYKSINSIIYELYQINKRLSFTVLKYFEDMEKVIINVYKTLKKGKKFVIKIGNSKIKKIEIETGKILSEIACNNGFKLIGIFNDKINSNSRSLTISRNYYSDIILDDNIVILEKI